MTTVMFTVVSILWFGYYKYEQEIYVIYNGCFMILNAFWYIADTILAHEDYMESIN